MNIKLDFVSFIFYFSIFVSFLGHQNPALEFLNFLEISATVSYKAVSYKKNTCIK